MLDEAERNRILDELLSLDTPTERAPGDFTINDVADRAKVNRHVAAGRVKGWLNKGWVTAVGWVADESGHKSKLYRRNSTFPAGGKAS